MDEGTTATRKPPAPAAALPSLRPVFGRGIEPHHRRRRAAALAGLAVLALIVGASVGASRGPSAHHAVRLEPGYFSRIHMYGGVGAGSFAAYEKGAEVDAINRTLHYTPYVRIAGSQHREVALTFDDGPGPYTPEILSVLDRADVPATFFEVGVLEHYFHNSTSVIATRGYSIGDHTESHSPMGRLSPKDQRAQLLEQVTATGQYGAPYPRLFRPPYGSWNHVTLRLLRKYKMLMVLWTVDTNDYRRPGVAAIVHAAVVGARSGAIILLHDAGGDRAQTVAALPKIIAALRRRGYRFVTIPRLLLDNPAPRNQDISALVGSGG